MEVSGGSVRFKQASEFKCALKSFHMILVQKYMADHTTPRHFLGEQDSSHAKVNRGIKDAALAPPICGDYTNTLSPLPRANNPPMGCHYCRYATTVHITHAIVLASCISDGSYREDRESNGARWHARKDIQQQFNYLSFTRKLQVCFFPNTYINK